MEVELAEPITVEELERRLAPQALGGSSSARWRRCPKAARRSASEALPTKPRFLRRSKPVCSSGSSIFWPPRRGHRARPRARDDRPASARLSWRWRGRARDAAPSGTTGRRRPPRRTVGVGLPDLEHQGIRLRTHRRGDLRMNMQFHLSTPRAPCRLECIAGRYCRLRKRQHETGNADSTSRNQEECRIRF